jgi:polysaccharide biosynthesis transport protein
MDTTSTPIAEDSSTPSLSDLWAILQLQRGVIVASIVACVGLAAMLTAVAEKQYRAVAVVHLAPVAAKEINTDGVNTEITASWNRNIDVATKLAILDSNSLRAEVVRRYQELGLADGINASALGGEVSSDARKGTELIDIAVTTNDPEMSARLANLVAEVFRDESMAGNIEAARSAREWLSAQISEYEDRIRDATAALNEFERKNNLAGSTEHGESSLDSRMVSLNLAFGNSNTELVIQETLVEDYERLLRTGRYQDLAKAMDSAVVDSLSARYADALVERSRVGQVYGEKMPEYKSVAGNVDAIERELKAEVIKMLSAERAKLELLGGRKDSIAGAIGSGKEQILQLQALWGEYEQKRTELSNAKDFYQRLRARTGELELQSKTQFNRARILERATPPTRHSFPIVWLNLLIGLILGLAGGFALAVLREWLDDTIGSPVDITAYLRVPFLGAIPIIADEKDETRLALYTHAHPRAIVAEAMRAVRTTLELSPVNEVPRRILVTSAVASEGKTSTAIRLGISFVNAHRSVVIVDCDLRRPRVHKVFGGDRGAGVSALIDGAKLDEVTRETAVPNLYYIPSGRAGDRPDELLSAPNLPEILDALEARFDIVIIDSPPTLVVADARLLSRHVDGVLMVARENSTSRSLMREAIGDLQQVGAHIFGVVINAVDFNKRRTSYRYYGYGYGYQYKYDEDEPDAQPAK